MDIPPRQRYRLADLIRQQLLELQTVRYRGILAKVHGFLEAVAELRAANGRLACCVIRNWNVAAAEVTEQVSALLVNVPYHCGDVQRAIEGPKVQIPSVREVLAELDQLDEELDPVRYDPKLKVLTVTTEDIELEDVHLGPFEIQLQVAALRDLRHHGDVYRIVALEPNCACSNEDVTHPHVSSERLCEGDAGAAIGMALSNGRIADYEVSLSLNGWEWEPPVASGTWPNDATLKTVLFDRPRQAGFIKLVAHSEVRKQPFASAAEVDILVEE